MPKTRSNRAHIAYHELKMALNELGIVIKGDGTGGGSPMRLDYLRDRVVLANCCTEGVLAIAFDACPDQYERDLIQAHAALFRAIYLGQ